MKYYSIKTISDFLKSRCEFAAAQLLEECEPMLEGITATTCTNSMAIDYQTLFSMNADSIKEYFKNPLAHSFDDFIKENIEWTEYSDDILGRKIFKAYLTLFEPKNKKCNSNPIDFKEENNG